MGSIDGDKEWSSGPPGSGGGSRTLLGRTSDISLTSSPLAFNKRLVSEQSINGVGWNESLYEGLFAVERRGASQTTSLETWRPASDSSIKGREN